MASKIISEAEQHRKNRDRFNFIKNSCKKEKKGNETFTRNFVKINNKFYII